MWTKLGEVFSLAAHGQPWMKSHAMLPTPLLKDEVIRVYFTTREHSGMSRIAFADLDRADPRRVVRVSEQPLLEIGQPGAFDDSGTLTNFAMTTNGEVRLYYHGYNRRVVVPWGNAIGLAVSADGGETFRKAFEGPVIDRTPLEPYFAVGAWIVEDEGKFRLWYSSGLHWKKLADDVLEPIYVIKYGESDDGVTFRRDALTCIVPLNEEEANTRAAVIKRGGLFRMWYCFRGSQNFRDGADAYRIGYAESEDGRRWTRKDDEAGIELGAAGDWDGLMQAYPAVLQVDGKLLMFYNGDGFGVSGFGCAVMD